MTKQLVTVMNRVLRETGRAEVTAAEIDEDRLNEDQMLVLDKLNDKQQQIANEHNWDALQSFATFETENGEDQYTLQGKEINTNSGTKYKNPHPHKITYMEHQEVGDEIVPEVSDREFQLAADNDDTGDPEFFRVIDVSVEGLPVIQLVPEPDGAFTIYYEYHEKPSELTDSNDVSAVPERPLIWGTVESILDFDGVDFSRARSEFQRALQIAKANNNAGVDMRMGGDARSRPAHPLDNVDLPL